MKNNLTLIIILILAFFFFYNSKSRFSPLAIPFKSPNASILHMNGYSRSLGGDWSLDKPSPKK